MQETGFISTILRVFGRRPIAWLTIGALSAVVFSFLEIGIAKVLQVIFADLSSGSVGALEQTSWFARNLSGKLKLSVCLFSILGLSRSGVQFFINWSAGIVDRLAMSRLRQLALGHLMLIPQTKSASASKLMFQMDSIFPRATAYMSLVASIIPQLVMASGLIIALTLVNWAMGLFAVISVLLVGFILRRIGDFVHTQTQLQLRPMSDFVSGVGRVTRNWFFVRVMKAQATEYSRLSGLNVYSTSYSMRGQFVAIAASAFPSIGGVLMLSLLMLIQGKLVVSNGGSFLQFVYLLTRLVQILSNVAGSIGSLGFYRSSFEETIREFGSVKNELILEATRPLKYISMIRRPRERRLPRLDPRDAEVRKGSLGSLPTIALSNVSFSYDSVTEIFSKLNISISGGEQLGIIGPSGSGKSTLMSLILGLQQPTTGSVTMDGVGPDVYMDKEVSAVGYVGAEPFLIEGTIKDNLDYGQRFLYTENDYILALQQARLTNVIRHFPEGLNHRISENGEGLSAGEKQRVALARALLRRPKLLILDEVTANLDNDIEQEIANSLRSLKGKCTCLIVSHRPGILKFADRVFDLEKKAWAPMLRDLLKEVI